MPVPMFSAADHDFMARALRLADVLVRRTRLALITRDGARSVAPEAARLLAPVLGWDDDRVAAEVAAYEAIAPVVP